MSDVSAAFLDATQGPAPGDPYAAPPRRRPYLEEVGRDPGQLRITLHLRPLSGVAVDRACRRAATDASALLSALGHEVEEADPPGSAEELGRALWILVASSVVMQLRAVGRARGRPVDREEVDATSWNAVEFAQGLKVEDYPESLTVIHAQGRRMASFHDRLDILVSPTLARPPVPLGQLRTDTDDIRSYERSLARFSPFTQLANMTGQPSMSVPLHRSPTDLPVGVMFTAPFGREDMLFRLVAQLEVERPWSDQRPGRLS